MLMLYALFSRYNVMFSMLTTLVIVLFYRPIPYDRNMIGMYLIVS